MSEVPPDRPQLVVIQGGNPKLKPARRRARRKARPPNTPRVVPVGVLPSDARLIARLRRRMFVPPPPAWLVVHNALEYYLASFPADEPAPCPVNWDCVAARLEAELKRGAGGRPAV